MRSLVKYIGPTLLCSGFVATAMAQGVADSSDSSDSSDVTPPLVVSMPPVALSAESTEAARALADPRVTVVVRVEVDGTAVVEQCPSTTAICTDIRATIERARFVPAQRGGEALPSRVSLQLGLSVALVETEGHSADAAGQGSGSQRSGEADDDPAQQARPTAPSGQRPPPEPVEELMYGTDVVVARPPAGALRLTLEEARNLPGTFGDPFRAVEALPGVTPIFSGLPYFYVRGSPPSGTLYSYDSIHMPILFHLGLGPSVVHPRMVGPLRLYSGVAPARFGRFIGGVIEAEGPDATEDDIRGEAELRLLDVNAFVRAPIGKGELLLAGRYGYPGLVLSLASPDTSLSYWDYQLRFQYPLGRRTRFELVGLGSFDRLANSETDRDPATGEETTTESVLGIHFHRAEARLIQRFGHFEYGAALRFGWGTSFLDERGGPGAPEEVGVQSTHFGPRFWWSGRRPRLAFRIGGEMFGAAGDIDIGDMADGAATSAMNPAANQFLASVAARSLAAVYLELEWSPSRWMTYDLGFRSDLWMAGGTAELALDPRLRGTLHVHPKLDLHVAVGVSRQPAVFFLPLPGLDEVAVARGPQVALQSEMGLAVELTPDLELEAQAFVHRYTGLLFLDLFLDDETCLEDGIACERVEVPDRVSGLSYGAEIFLRADPKLRVSGFLSYTLSWAQLDALAGLDYTPSFDVRHVLNVAGRAQIIEDRLSFGLRLHVRTGKPIGVTYFSIEDLQLQRYEQRLPTFYRLDAEIALQWRTSWARFRLSLEWLNLTFSEEPTGIHCGDRLLSAPTAPCEVFRAQAIVLPNLGLRGTF